MVNQKEEILKIISEIKNISGIMQDTELIESGIIDSFDIINLISKLEEYFKIKIAGENIIPETLKNVFKIEELVNKSKHNV